MKNYQSNFNFHFQLDFLLGVDDDEMNLNDKNATETSGKARYALERADIVVTPSSSSCLSASAHGDSDVKTNPKRSSFPCEMCDENFESRSQINGHLAAAAAKSTQQKSI